ncbi:MAG: 2-amino-4-hydroxy-6-hydroxymethyldihydropteridine diphosphokinase [Treponema sp.]|nr:2-amino-4-hydroxy-6-hydroxymethyldihydropteridine diphosphokinase [Treponema sp.]
MKRVLLGLGSNNRFLSMAPLNILEKACEELRLILKDPVFSSVYKTRAMYVTDQEDFYNMACTGFVEDKEDAYEFLEKLHKIEAKYGRDRSREIRFGPRTLDLDIELWGKETFNDEVLEVPHPRLHERAFVLVPALEVLSETSEIDIIQQFENYMSVLDTKDVEKL